MVEDKWLRTVLAKHALWLVWDLRGERADLSGKDLSLQTISGANFRGAILRNTDFSGCFLYGTDFSEADCTGADFDGADVRGADFTKANLTGASLYCRYPSGTKWDGAILTDARGFGSWDERQRAAVEEYEKKKAAEKE